MKRLLYIVFLIPLLGISQTQTENYIETKAYRVPLKENQLGTSHKDSVSRSIQYFDGLGRLKQSIAVQAGGNVTHHNHLPIDWTLNHTGSTSFYNQNGSNNQIVSGITPFGDTDLLWDCGNDISSNNQGGFTTDNFTIDRTKTYRYTIWVKKTVDANSGNTYYGPNHVVNLDGSTNTNPYFWYGKLPQADTWYLLVGVVHPHNHTGGDTGLSGVYDTSGTKVIDGSEFKWNSSTIVGNFRSYLAYNSNINTRQYFWSPLVQQINGDQMPLNEVLSTSTVITLETKTQDIVRHYSYDALGRQAKEYLPIAVGNTKGNFVSGDVAQMTQQYYKVTYAEDFSGISISNVNAYSEKVFDGSPLNRVLETGAPGNTWAVNPNSDSDHTIKMGYAINSATDNLHKVRWYKVDSNGNLTNPSPNYYPVGGLYKVIIKDENWKTSSGKLHTTEEFQNKFGQTILKRTYAKIGNTVTPHDTYYVYNLYNNLAYLIPPKVITSDGISSTELDKLCYQYKYDKYNRLVEKKFPGKGWEHIVYDKLDRPVLTQDAIQRSKTSKEWLFTKYDALGRVVYTGKYTNDSIRTDIQTKVNSLSGTNIYEEKSGQTLMNGSSVYYSHRSYPATTAVTVFTINYYDTYTDLPTGFTAPTEVYKQTVTTNTKGLATVSKVRVLGTNYWITTVTYYDDKARPIYVYSKNEYLQTEDIVESKLDEFTGKVLETKTTHKKTGKNDIITIDRFEYDHMDRLISQTQKINDQTSNRVVKNNYDNLGQLKSKLTGNGTKSGYTDVTSGITINNDIITKVSGIDAWSEGLATLGSIQGDGYVEYTMPQHDAHTMIGLSDVNSNAHYNTIDYAIYNHNDDANKGKVYLWEPGTGIVFIGYFVTGDVFRIERIGDKVYYKKNGKVFHTSATRSTGTLIGDVSMKTVGGKIKDLKIVDNSKGLQKVDYAYNVRGWLKKINSDGVNDNDLFNFSLRYNDITDVNKRLYNGNISQTSWNTASPDSSTKTYTYTYDALNRISSAIGTTTANYDLKLVNYDKNGNITKLHRSENINGYGYLTLAKYSYTYDLGNKLTNLSLDTDASYSDSRTYNYDNNGNLSTEERAYENSGNKEVNLGYNHLNLPTSVYVQENRDEYFSNQGDKTKIEGTIYYVYAADGTKLSKRVEDDEKGTESITQYAGNYIYKDNNLQFFNHSEGYVTPVIASGSTAISSFNYVYQYKDHLGNIRLSYADANKDGIITASTEIIEESNYYPFGLKHKGYNNTVSSNGNSAAQKWGYTGKEHQEELGLDWIDIMARNYDPAIGRFFNVDPMADSPMQVDKSPFAYTWNNPVKLTDPDGMHPDWDERAQAALGFVNLGAGADIMSYFGNGTSGTVKKTGKAEAQAYVATAPDGTQYVVTPKMAKKLMSRGAQFGGNISANDCCGGFDSALAFQEAISRVSSSLLFSGLSREYYIQKAKGLKSIYGNDFIGGSTARTKLKGLVRNRMTPYLFKRFLDWKSPNVNKYHSIRRPTPSYWKTNKWVNLGGRLSGALGIAGTGYQLYGVYNYFHDPTNTHVVDPSRFIADTFFTGVMYYGGPVGFIVGGVYHLGSWGYDNGYVKPGNVPKNQNGRTRADYRICFIAGTKISMADGSLRNIEDIKNGEFIKTYNFEKKIIENKPVVLSEKSFSNTFVEIQFEDGNKNINTLSHPYYIKDKGWSSFDPQKTFNKYGIKVQKIKNGDIAFKIKNGDLIKIKIISLKIIKKHQKTYNLSNVKDNHNFFANGILVHNRS